MMRLLRWFIFSGLMYAVEPSLASAAPAADPAKPAADPAAPPAADPAKPAVDPAAPAAAAAPKPEEVTAATEFLTKNVDGFTPDMAKGKKPEEIMALRAAHDLWSASEARKFLKSSGVKADDVAKMSNADAIKAADEARAKPVQYGDFKLPDGVVKHEAMDKEFKDWAGKHKISPEAAQELISNVYGKHLAEVVNQPYKQWEVTQGKWREEVSKDPVVGGANLDKNMGQIGTMIDTVFPDKKEAELVRQAMDLTGFGNHPAGVKFLYMLSKAFVEGEPGTGGPAVRDPATGNPAAKLYPAMASAAASG